MLGADEDEIIEEYRTVVVSVNVGLCSNNFVSPYWRLTADTRLLSGKINEGAFVQINYRSLFIHGHVAALRYMPAWG